MYINVRDQSKYWHDKNTNCPFIGIPENQILQQARLILEGRSKRSNFLTSPDKTREFLKSTLAEETRELFALIYLDNQHGVLNYEVLFQGTIDSSAVYPREVIKKVLDQNAASVIFAHNHPSGVPEPSKADERITTRLIEALSTIDVTVLDHFIVGGTKIISFAERGLL